MSISDERDDRQFELVDGQFESVNVKREPHVAEDKLRIHKNQRRPSIVSCSNYKHTLLVRRGDWGGHAPENLFQRLRWSCMLVGQVGRYTRATHVNELKQQNNSLECKFHQLIYQREVNRLEWNARQTIILGR